MKRTIYTVVAGVVINLNLALGQLNVDDEYDKCGNPVILKSVENMLGDNWGYGYSNLQEDLKLWGANEFINIASIGKSTQGRELQELTISDFRTDVNQKKRIYIHARTHPNEVQSTYVTNEIVKLLVNDSKIGKDLREKCIFNILPMYNPDGVELEKPRENANNIDIESNWGSPSPEIEVVNLRNRFAELMTKDNPVQVALNMHSAIACKRYFVYHHANGTSDAFAQKEQEFIGAIKEYFTEGIESYNYFVSWQNSTPDRYPESWWWNNYGEGVMALTYEDMNCGSAGFYDKTAYAILGGIASYLKIGSGYTTSARNADMYEEFRNKPLKLKVFPNPFDSEVIIEWNNFNRIERGLITDIFGRPILYLAEMEGQNGYFKWDGFDSNGAEVPAGTYIVQVAVNNQVRTVKLVKR